MDGAEDKCSKHVWQLADSSSCRGWQVPIVRAQGLRRNTLQPGGGLSSTTFEERFAARAESIACCNSTRRS
eukprot:1858938-Amphidinium_carterae.1